MLRSALVQFEQAKPITPETLTELHDMVPMDGAARDGLPSTVPRRSIGSAPVATQWTAEQVGQAALALVAVLFIVWLWQEA